MQEILLKIRYFERGWSKSLKKANFIFSFEPSLLMAKLIKDKSCLELVTSHTSGYLWNKFKNIPLFVIYYLTKFDDVMWSSFIVIPKITSVNLCKSIHDIINYSTSIYPFESGKCGKEGKKLQNLNISRMKRAF